MYPQRKLRRAYDWLETVTETEYNAIMDDALAMDASFNEPPKARTPFKADMHGLIMGGTGSGKSEFVKVAIEDMTRQGVKVYIIDGKQSHDYDGLLPADQICNEPRNAGNLMHTFATNVRNRNGKVWPVAYPIYLFVDEISAFEGDKEFQKNMEEVYTRGRSAKIYMTVVGQSLPRKLLSSRLQENASQRIVLRSFATRTAIKAVANVLIDDAASLQPGQYYYCDGAFAQYNTVGLSDFAIANGVTEKTLNDVTSADML